MEYEKGTDSHEEYVSFLKTKLIHLTGTEKSYELLHCIWLLDSVLESLMFKGPKTLVCQICIALESVKLFLLPGWSKSEMKR